MKTKLTLLNTDFYQATMTTIFVIEDKANEQVGFEAFYRHPKKAVNPDNDFYVFSGEEDVHVFMNQIRFEVKHRKNAILNFFLNYVIPKFPEETRKEVARIFDEKFYSVREDFEYEVAQEGSILKPLVPYFQFNGPRWIGQLIESRLLNITNGRTANETIVSLSKDVQTDWENYENLLREFAKTMRQSTTKPIVEGGLRRAYDEVANVATKIAFEEGWNKSSNVWAFQEEMIPSEFLAGTMAHAFILAFNTEKEAFEVWNKWFPNSTILIDTYDVFEAVKTLIENNIKPKFVRIDSDPLKEYCLGVRAMLDEANWNDVGIFISGDLEPQIVREFEEKGVPFDMVMVGTKFVNLDFVEQFNSGFVYKLVENEINGTKTFPQKKATGKFNYPALKRMVYDEATNIINITKGFGYENMHAVKRDTTVNFSI